MVWLYLLFYDSESDVLGLCLTMVNWAWDYKIIIFSDFESDLFLAVVQPIPILPISVPEPTEDDITNTPHMAGANVVDLCIQKLNSWNPKNNNGFLRRVAYVVSEFGKNTNTTESDGIWQVSQTVF